MTDLTADGLIYALIATGCLILVIVPTILIETDWNKLRKRFSRRP